MYFVDKFCCIAKLRTGTLILGSLLSASTACYFVTDFIRLSITEYEEEIFVYKISTTANLLLLIINCCLVYGAYKESRYYLLPWLIVVGAIQVMAVFMALVLALVVPIFLAIFIFLGPSMYLWICVMSFYQSLDPHNPNYANAAVNVSIGTPPAYDGAAVKYPEVV